MSIAPTGCTSRTGLPSWTGFTKAATVPTGIACAGALQLAGPLAALGLTAVGAALHALLAVVAPLNVFVMWLGFRSHGRPLPLLLAGLGLLALIVHAATHLQPVPDTWSAWVGVGLLIAAGALDWRALRRAS
ncbi:MAG: MerC family mercury resistance protein [Chloroflexota bacterium]